jgi:hypothetical protein
LEFELAELFEFEPEPEDPQAASPTARTPAAATVMSLLCSTNLLMCLRLPVVDTWGGDSASRELGIHIATPLRSSGELRSGDVEPPAGG